MTLETLNYYKNATDKTTRSYEITTTSGKKFKIHSSDMMLLTDISIAVGLHRAFIENIQPL